MDDNGLYCALKASYPDFKLDVSFSVARGELVCILGPSGCGKSTTLQLITGLIPPDEGTVRLMGNDITDTPVNERKVAMVFQDYALFPHMSVAQNIAYPMKLQKKGKAERKTQTEQLLSLVSLSGYGNRKPQELSGGERQRVALARALASEPNLLLLDEPLSALDAKLRKHLRNEIRSIHDKTGVTTLYVTHDQEEALAIADRLIVMHDGTIEQIGTGEEIYRNPATLFVASFMGEGNLVPAERHGMLFFRPEDVLVQDEENLPLPQFLPCIEFGEATVERCEFAGTHYRISCRQGNNLILATSPRRPQRSRVRIGVPKDRTRLFDADEPEKQSTT
jgi:ABC-type Fe3+/spermidine/putrescine transport system ATPase subunit